MDTSEKQNDICCICLEVFTRKQVKALLPCNHAMHFTCALPLVHPQKDSKAIGTCPICRAEYGDFMEKTVADAIALAVHNNMKRYGIIKGNKEEEESDCQRGARELEEKVNRELEFLKSHPRREPSPTFVLFVKGLDGQTYSIQTSPMEYVGNLMLKIQEDSGIPYKQMRLLFAGRQLEAMYTFIDYNIRTEATIHLVLSLRGGKPVICFHSMYDESKLGFAVTLNRTDAKFTSLWPAGYKKTETPDKCASVSWVADYKKKTGMLSMPSAGGKMLDAP